jgi:hypothetical protein
MDRINTDTKAENLFGAGKHGFKDGDLGLGIEATDLDAQWFNDAQEELIAVIEAAGLVPAVDVRTQIRQAIKRIAGGNVTTVNAGNSPLVLTADNAGLVIMDASAGNISATLPAANVLSAMSFKFVRTDAAANSATVNRAGGDMIDGANSFTLAPYYDHRSITAAGGTSWLTVAAKPAGFGQCYLDKSGLNLVLSRSNGFLLSIAGVPQVIPAAGVSLAPTGLLAATLYYIYESMVAGVMTSEASTTVPVIDANTGQPVKTGDPTRTLVGAWKTAGAGVWSTIPTEGASWFNRREKSYVSRLTTGRSTASATPTEAHSEIRVPFFMWAGEMPLVIVAGCTSNTTGGVNAVSQISWNGGAAEGDGVRCNSPANSRIPFALIAKARAAGILAEGLHYATLFTSSDAGQTSTWEGGGAQAGTSLLVITKG